MKHALMLLYLSGISVLLSLLLFALPLVGSFEAKDMALPTNLNLRRGLVVIPGLGRSDRLKTVEHNVKLLEPYFHGQDPLLECVIYVYTSRDTDTDFWQNYESLNYIAKYCTFIENHGRRVTENLFMVQPSLIEEVFDFVFILFDDCKLISVSTDSAGKQRFPLDRLLYLMEFNQLSIVSPLVNGANTGGGQQFRTIMQRPAIEGTEGYVSSFVEMFCWVLRFNAYKALWELLYPSVNPYGWGYDFWYDYYGKTHVAGHKMGIASRVEVKHEQDFGAPGEGRTDTASVKEKWRGVQEQEKLYKAHLGIDLPFIRKQLDLKNSSWNGAVKGYLYG